MHWWSYSTSSISVLAGAFQTFLLDHSLLWAGPNRRIKSLHESPAETWFVMAEHCHPTGPPLASLPRWLPPCLAISSPHCLEPAHVVWCDSTELWDSAVGSKTSKLFQLVLHQWELFPLWPPDAACVSFEHRSHLCNPLCSSLVTVTYWHRLAYWIVRNRLNGSYCADNRSCGNVKVEIIILLIPPGQNTPPILHFTLSWGSGFSGTWLAVLDFSAQCSHCSPAASLSLTWREKCHVVH